MVSWLRISIFFFWWACFCWRAFRRLHTQLLYKHELYCIQTFNQRQNELGHFAQNWAFLRFINFKRRKYSFPPLSPPCMEGTGEGCGFLCSPKLPYLSTMSQQFCRRLLVVTGLVVIYVYSEKRLIDSTLKKQKKLKISLFSEVTGFCVKQRQGDTPQVNFMS